jgi:hypothetical protein
MARYVVASSGRDKFQVLRDFIRVGTEYSSEALAIKIKGELEQKELKMAQPRTARTAEAVEA